MPQNPISRCRFSCLMIMSPVKRVPQRPVVLSAGRLRQKLTFMPSMPSVSL